MSLENNQHLKQCTVMSVAKVCSKVGITNKPSTKWKQRVTGVGPRSGRGCTVLNDRAKGTNSGSDQNRINFGTRSAR
jgi:hypothetical protein